MSSVASSSSLVFTTHRRRQPLTERKTTHSSASWSEKDYCSEKERTKMRALSEAHKSFLGRWHRDASKNENVFEYLEAHDMDGDRSTATYVQVWETTTYETTNKSLGEGEFTVRTVSSTGTKRKYSAQGRQKCTEKPRGMRVHARTKSRPYLNSGLNPRRERQMRVGIG